VCHIVREACPNTNAIIPVPVGDESGHVSVPTYDWQSKFQCNMTQIRAKILPAFLFSKADMGKAQCSKTVDDSGSTTFKVVKDSSATCVYFA